MYRHDDCMCESKECSKEYSKKSDKEYAKAYILPQEYEHLYSCKEGFLKGTIFKDLYKPYHHHDHEHHNYVQNYEYKKIKVER